MQTTVHRSLSGFVGWILASTALCCSASEDFPGALDPKPNGRFTASKDSSYGPLEPPAKKQIAFENQNARSNAFCVVGYTYPGGESAVWVHWQEEERLLLWRPSSDAEMREKGWAYAERDLKLGKDTVEKVDDLEGSTYRVTRAWWNAVAQDCDAHGEKITLPPFTPAPD
jgi:hypothetical protein